MNEKNQKSDESDIPPATTAIIMLSALVRAQQIGVRRTGIRIPLSKVPFDPATSEGYCRALERGVRAARTWKPDGGMTLEAWIDASIFMQDSVDCFETPLTMSKGIAFDFMGSRKQGTEVHEWRAMWAEMGHDPLDWDRIFQAGAPTGTDHGPDADEADDWHDDDGNDPGSTGWSHVEVEVMGRLFYTEDLDEVETRVYWLKRAGYSNDEIVEDHLPAGMFDGYADPANQISKIHATAIAKSESFRVDL